MSDLYRAARYSGRGEPEVVGIGLKKRRHPRAGEVVIEVESSAVSASDVMVRRGVIPVPLRIFVPGYDLVGRIVATGAGVDPSLAGKRAIALVISGGNAEYAYARPNQLVSVPETLDSVKAAAMGLNYATALRLIAFAPSGALLYQGLTGGLGSALMDLSRLFPGLTLAGTVSPGTEYLAEQHGAKAWAYDRPDLIEAIRREHPGGFDVVFDPFGGKRRDSLAALVKREGGKVIGMGFQGPSFLRLGYLTNLIAYRFAGPSRRFFSIASLSRRSPTEFAPILRELARLIAEDELNPLVAGVYDLDDLAAAQRHFERKGTSGKVVIRVR